MAKPFPRYQRESHCLMIGEQIAPGLIFHRASLPISETSDWIDVISVINEWAREAFPDATAVTSQSADRFLYSTWVAGRQFHTRHVSARLAS